MRKKFNSTGLVPVSDIMLDQQNYRLGPLESQSDCVLMMLQDYNKEMFNISRHIAVHGLSPQHIILIKDAQGRWVVRDGNRRVTALKLLNNPDEAPDEFRAAIRTIKNSATDPTNIPQEIECLTADAETVLEYMKHIHSGPQDGVGQLDWGSREKDNLQEATGGKVQSPIARAVCAYLVGRGVQDAAKVYITTMQRLFQDLDVRERIGLGWDGSSLSFEKQEDDVFEVLKVIISDFANKTKNVNNVFYAETRNAYISELFDQRGIKAPEPYPPVGGASGATVSAPAPTPAPAATNKMPHPVSRAPRRRLWVVQRSLGLPIPQSESKLLSIQAELATAVNVQEAPIAAGVLVRLLVEYSVEHYGKINGVVFKPQFSLHEKIKAVALFMQGAGAIDKKYRQVLEKMSQSNELVSAHTLNAWVHNSNYTPMAAEVVTLWDNLRVFLVQCWA